MGFFGEDSSSGGSNSFSDKVAKRSGNILGNISKGALESAIPNSGSARERALGALGSAAGGAILGRIFGEDGDQAIPPQYNGASNIQREKKSFLDSYSYANQEYFNSVVGDYEYKYNTNHPMTKSLFIVDFEFNQEITENSGSNRLKNLYKNSTTFLLKGMTFPRAEIEMVKINEYNHHKNVPRRMNYTPITCRFGDIYRTYNNSEDKISIMDLYKEYMSYYYNDFEVDSTNYHFGHNSDRDFSHFINSITIYFFWADGSRKIKIQKPLIKSFSYDDLSYENDDPMVVSCEMDYEYIDMSELTLTYDEFIIQTNHILDKIQGGLQDTNVPNPYANMSELTPGVPPQDTGRNLALDNPASQTLLRMAEIEAVQFAGDSLTSDNPLERILAQEGVSIANDAAGGVGGFLGGLF